MTIAAVAVSRTISAGTPSTGIPAASYDLSFTGSGLPSGVSLARTSTGTATYFNTNAIMVTAADNVARIDYRHSVGGQPVCLGLLIEPATTQLVKKCRDLDDATWTPNSVTVTADQSNGPDGLKKMELITNGASLVCEVLQPISVTANTRYSITCFARAAAGSADNFLVVQFSDRSSIWGGGFFNLTSGDVGSTFTSGVWTVHGTATSVLPGGIIQCSVSMTPSTSHSTNFSCYLQTNDANGGALSATPGATAYVGYVQVEAASDPSSFVINDTTSTVNRGADTVTVTMTNATYDILVEDVDGAEWRDAVVVGAGTYTLTPRSGQRHVTRMRAWTTGTLTTAQKQQLAPLSTGGGGDSGGSGGGSSGGGTSGGGGTGTVIRPPALSGTTYVLDFNDDFDNFQFGDIGVSHGKPWTNGVANNYGAVPAGQFSASNSILTITAVDGGGGNYNDPNLCSTNGVAGDPANYYAAGDYYIEARIKPTNWTAFWSFPQYWLENNSVVANDPNTWVAEIDYLETSEPDFPNAIFINNHRNTGGPHAGTDPDDAGISDELGRSGWDVTGATVCGAWSTFACWRTGTRLRWYYNDQLIRQLGSTTEIADLPGWTSGAQPEAIILGIGAGGVNSGASPASIGTLPVTAQFDWVRVWRPSSAAPPPSTLPESGHTKPGYTLTFLDDFDGTTDTDGQIYFDRTKWNSALWPVAYGKDTGGDGSRYLGGNVEQQIYCDKDYRGNGVPTSRIINPFSFSNSVLRIESGRIPNDLLSLYWAGSYRVFYSGMLNTERKFYQQYGLFEARIKMPKGIGAWPAFWLLPHETEGQVDQFGNPKHDWPPEIDILEQFPYLATRNKQTHWGMITVCSDGFGCNSNGTGGAGAWKDVAVDVTADFHIYSLEWNQTQMVWYFDGQEIARQNTPASMNRPMYILLNVAVGGEWYRGEAGYASGDYMALVNAVDAQPSLMPYHMEVDWVRAYSKT